MSQFFSIHPDNPQSRLVSQAVEILNKGGVIIYPTDSGYALGCHLGDKSAMERIQRIRRLDDKHNFTLVCRDLSEIGTYAKLGNSMFRFIKSHTPGAYTFILNATTEVPRRLMHPKRRTIGIRIPDNKIAMAIAEALGEPIMSTTLIMPDEELPLTDPYDIRDLLEHAVDLVIDGGYCGMDPTTVLNLTDDEVVIVREGAGPTDTF